LAQIVYYCAMKNDQKSIITDTKLLFTHLTYNYGCDNYNNNNEHEADSKYLQIE
jgi:hypothetical protein